MAHFFSRAARESKTSAEVSWARSPELDQVCSRVSKSSTRYIEYPFHDKSIADIFLAYRPKDLPAHDTKIIIMEELKAEALRISSSQSQPSLAARLISRLIESNPSWSDEKLAMSQAGDAKKPKSPEQIDYARERQRIARKAKRLQKKF